MCRLTLASGAMNEPTNSPDKVHSPTKSETNWLIHEWWYEKWKSIDGQIIKNVIFFALMLTQFPIQFVRRNKAKLFNDKKVNLGLTFNDMWLCYSKSYRSKYISHSGVSTNDLSVSKVELKVQGNRSKFPCIVSTVTDFANHLILWTTTMISVNRSRKQHKNTYSFLTSFVLWNTKTRKL